MTLELPTTLEAFFCYKYARNHWRIREPFPVPVAGEEPDTPQLPAVAAASDGKRRCGHAGCGALLSRFNEGGRCALHA